jgi:hypothetical protein
MVFPPNSPFTRTAEQSQTLEDVRQQALEAKTAGPTRNKDDRLVYIGMLIEGAESALADQDYDQVVRLVSQARDELAHGFDVGA